MYASVSVQHKCDYMRVLIRSSFPLNPIPRPSTLHVSQDHATMPFHTTARQKFANHSHHSLHTITHASPTSERAKRQTSAQSPRWLIERRRRGPFSHCFLYFFGKQKTLVKKGAKKRLRTPQARTRRVAHMTTQRGSIDLRARHLSVTSLESGRDVRKEHRRA